MTPSIIEFVKKHSKHYNNVLEVGSLNFNGTIRDAIRCNYYLGVDRMDGPCVDLVIEDVSEITDTFDAIVCCEVLEHDPNPWKTVNHLKSLLVPNGTLIISTPTFGFPIHRYPIDCYRFGMDAYTNFLFKNFDIIAIDTLQDLYGYPIICCVGTKGMNNNDPTENSS